MKTRLLLLIVAMCLFSMGANATVLIYEGSTKSVVTGKGERTRLRRGTFFVFDFSSRQVRRIHFFGKGAGKLYVVRDVENFDSSLIAGPNNTTYKDIVDAETTTPVAGQILTHSLFLKGLATEHAIGGGLTRVMPERLTGLGRDFDENNTANQRFEDKISANFRADLTIATNDVGGGLTGGVDEVKAFLEKHGYAAEN